MTSNIIKKTHSKSKFIRGSFTSFDENDEEKSIILQVLVISKNDLIVEILEKKIYEEDEKAKQFAYDFVSKHLKNIIEKYNEEMNRLNGKDEKSKQKDEEKFTITLRHSHKNSDGFRYKDHEVSESCFREWKRKAVQDSFGVLYVHDDDFIIY